MSSIRPIDPVARSEVTPAMPKTPIPRFEVVDPRKLHVDATYQRTISERGRRQVRKIIQEFCWTRYKPPICSYGDADGQRVLMVVDGQHTAIAAATNPYVNEIPIMIVEAGDTAAQAAAFVGQNTDRLSVTPLHLHHAAVAARDEDALNVERVCERAGVKILRAPRNSAKYDVGETIAVTCIGALVRRHTAMAARQILEVLVKGGLAPITAHHVRAVEFLMTDKEHRTRFEPEDLSTAIGELFLVAEDEARTVSYKNRMPFWHGLAAAWFRKTKKRRRHLRAVA